MEAIQEIFLVDGIQGEFIQDGIHAGNGGSQCF